MSPLLNLANDYAIFYRLATEPGLVRLRLWEMHPHPEVNPQPYLYVVNYTFGHRREAEQFLHDYLVINGAFDVPETQWPSEGEIAILPFPTWSSNTAQ